MPDIVHDIHYAEVPGSVLPRVITLPEIPVTTVVLNTRNHVSRIQQPQPVTRVASTCFYYIHAHVHVSSKYMPKCMILQKKCPSACYF
jgi:hypothetical protein